MDIPITQNEKIQFDHDSKMHISFEETTPSESSSSTEIISIQSTLEDSSSSDKFDTPPIEDILPDDSSSEIIPINIDQPVEFSCIDNHRERTISETSSDTVDYDFDIETYTTLKFDSSQSTISLSDHHDNEC